MFSFFLTLAVGIGIGMFLSSWARNIREEAEKQSQAESQPALSHDSGENAASLFQLAQALEPAVEHSAHPRDLLGHPAFEQGLQMLIDPDVPVSQVVDYCLGGNWILGLMASEALSRREDSADSVQRVLDHIGQAPQWPLYFRLRFIAARASEPVIGRVLCSVDEYWADQPVTVQIMSDFVKARAAEAEPLSFGPALVHLPGERLELVTGFVRRLDSAVAEPLLADIARHRAGMVDEAFLRSIGRLWDKVIEGPPVLIAPSIEQCLEEMRRAFTERPVRSILLVGESGVGKTALRRAFSKDLVDAGWRVFETTGAGLIANKSYIGEIEGQVRKLVANARVSKRIALYVERFSELATIGRHQLSPDSVLDQLLPQLEAHEVFVVSEATPQAYQNMLREFPSLPVLMKVIQLKTMDEAEARDLADQFLEVFQPEAPDEARSKVVAEAMQLASQYWSHKALPGRVISLIGLGVLRAEVKQERVLERTHLLDAMGELTGLPEDVLDEQQRLDIGELRAQFLKRVVGQDEAVEALVERISMLKAGLTDPGRPVGVYLFAGPTGTGKTELAKTLASILFGTEEQMIRLDMSEFQTPESLGRILEAGDELNTSASLVNLIRKQPFSVVLLDEFEKAHAKVWDLFLQVFDDGRLTDSQGNTADFRHAIIILTSNLGATISNEAGIGFTGSAGQFSAAEVQRAVNRAFRREFINRLDRVIIFRPLSREIMRGILRRELDKALKRRGLRTRSWAVEWEDSAIEFLLAEGFTPDLGARPLRRAIERHLLAPLSMTIVENQAPEGDQFLFVRSDGTDLKVEFVDPDADEAATGADHDDKPAEISVERLVVHASGATAERELLIAQVDSIAERLADAPWRSTKAAYLDEINADGFWERDDRQDVLDRVELMDRIESAAAVLKSLAGRLQQSGAGAKLSRRVANKLYVLEEGLTDFDQRRPTQAVLGLRVVREDQGLPGSSDFLERLSSMYRRWARQRRMQFTDLTATDNADTPTHVMIVSGFGSYGILAREAGLHVLELPRGQHAFDRVRVRVVVSPASVEQGIDRAQRARAARAALRAADQQGSKIVRRYRELPSPLVRDDVYGWRTGRIDAIWEGQFDVWV